MQSSISSLKISVRSSILFQFKFKGLKLRCNKLKKNIIVKPKVSKMMQGWCRTSNTVCTTCWITSIGISIFERECCLTYYQSQHHCNQGYLSRENLGRSWYYSKRDSLGTSANGRTMAMYAINQRRSILHERLLISLNV